MKICILVFQAPNTTDAMYCSPFVNVPPLHDSNMLFPTEHPLLTISVLFIFIQAGGAQFLLKRFSLFLGERAGWGFGG
ncbi:hypothetical protein BLX06_30540 [Bacillus cereus]|uniref:Uncharacterized protein n=1 Tax=Bacillus cereus TaxID=1396 RepID=A0A9X6GCX7_BACCE|nr:hypothetical protein BLX06_30540 [Bacillus cereus]